LMTGRRCSSRTVICGESTRCSDTQPRTRRYLDCRPRTGRGWAEPLWPSFGRADDSSERCVSQGSSAATSLRPSPGRNGLPTTKPGSSAADIRATPTATIGQTKSQPARSLSRSPALGSTLACAPESQLTRTAPSPSID
jgi:hypothetical protein